MKTQITRAPSRRRRRRQRRWPLFLLLAAALVIAVGCTGGHHRSVAIAHALTEFIRQKGYRVEETHRDISR